MRMRPREWAERYGWDKYRIKRALEQEYAGPCWHCGTLYATMGHGLADLTVDIVRPDDEPYWGTNTRLCCMTCNREKSRMPSELYERRRQEWARHRAWQAAKTDARCRGLALFDHAAGVERFDAPPYVQRQRCQSCGRLCDAEAFFRKQTRPGGLGHVHVSRRPICVGCMQDARDKRVCQDRWLEKAVQMIGFHCRRHQRRLAEGRSRHA
jgi:hypothetical protein